jgi:hypothetical protein
VKNALAYYKTVSVTTKCFAALGPCEEVERNGLEAGKALTIIAETQQGAARVQKDILRV